MCLRLSSCQSGFSTGRVLPGQNEWHPLRIDADLDKEGNLILDLSNTVTVVHPRKSRQQRAKLGG